MKKVNNVQLKCLLTSTDKNAVANAAAKNGSSKKLQLLLEINTMMIIRFMGFSEVYKGLTKISKAYGETETITEE